MRGLIVTPVVTATDEVVHLSNPLQEGEIQKIVLLYDQIVWFRNFYGIASPPECDFLEQQDILKNVYIDPGFHSGAFKSLPPNLEAGGLELRDNNGALLNAYGTQISALEADRPNFWHCTNVKLDYPESENWPKRIAFELIRRLKVPDREVPLDEIIDYRKANSIGKRRFWDLIDDISNQYAAHSPEFSRISRASIELDDAIQEVNQSTLRVFGNKIRESPLIFLLKLAAGAYLLSQIEIKADLITFGAISAATITVFPDGVASASTQQRDRIQYIVGAG